MEIFKALFFSVQKEALKAKNEFIVRSKEEDIQTPQEQTDSMIKEQA